MAGEGTRKRCDFFCFEEKKKRDGKFFPVAAGVGRGGKQTRSKEGSEFFPF